MTASLWAMLAAICWGTTPILEKMGLDGKIDSVTAVFLRSLGVLLGTIGFVIFVPRVLAEGRALPARNLILLMCGGLLASILGQLFFYRALKVGEVSKVVTIGASYPVLACILGVLLMNESVTVQKVMGVLFVMAGTYLLR